MFSICLELGILNMQISSGFISLKTEQNVAQIVQSASDSHTRCCRFYRECPTLSVMQFFLSLFKNPLTPPPRFEHLVDFYVSSMSLPFRQ